MNARAPLSLALEGALAIITLARPPVNAVDEDWLASLDEATQDLVRKFLSGKR